jgi:hypothetical protein
MLNVDEEPFTIKEDLKHSRLEPTAASLNRSGETTSPLDRVTVILVQIQIF